MTTLNLRRFSSPASLKTIDLGALVHLLGREGGEYVTDRLTLALDPESFDYPGLALLLANPEEGFPERLADALHHIHELADPVGLEAMLDAMEERGIRLGLGPDPTPADVAVRLWLHDPDLAERVHAERFIVRPRSFVSWMGLGRSAPLPSPTSGQLAALEEHLDDWFEKKKRGRHSKVFVFERSDGTWFLVRHGQAMDRRGVIRDGRSTSSFERPERYDVVCYTSGLDELRIHARTKGEQKLYREAFGLHLFGDASYFPDTGKYTLAPLVEDGEDALACDDIEGIEHVTLREVRQYYGGAEPEVLTRRAPKGDLFAVLRARRRSLDREPFQASFLVKFTGSRNPRTVTLKPPNVATYQREADQDLVSRWLEARGFVRTARADERAA